MTTGEPNEYNLSDPTIRVTEAVLDEWTFVDAVETERSLIERAFGSSLTSERHPDRNEDSLLIDEKNNLFAVFDGVGGHDGGEVASGAAKDTASLMAEGVAEFSDLATAEEYLRQILITANEDVIYANPEAATTAVLAKIHQINGVTYVSVAHVGDSRAYLLSDGVLKALTTDHTPFRQPGFTLDAMNQQEKLADTDTISVLSPAEIAAFRQRNIIGACLGRGYEVKADIKHFAVKPGDSIILTSDGIHDNLTTKEILAQLTESDGDLGPAYALTTAASERAKQLHMRSKMDDITAVVMNI